MVTDLPNLPLAFDSAASTVPIGDAQPWPMAVGCALLLLAVLAAHTSASLLVYSPTRLKKLMGPTRGVAALELLRAHDLEFRVLARAGDSFQDRGLEYRILQVDNRRVTKVRLTLLEPHSSDH